MISESIILNALLPDRAYSVSQVKKITGLSKSVVSKGLIKLEVGGVIESVSKEGSLKLFKTKQESFLLLFER